MARMRYACQLVDAQYSKGERTLIRANGADEAHRLDEMLWTFRDQAFIPHEVASTTAPHPQIMALIAGDSFPISFSTTLINIGNSAPDTLDSIAHLIEVVDADPQHKQQARERYKQYRDRGFTLETKNF